jgi:D-alanyl-D-alanine carboxypeptidase
LLKSEPGASAAVRVNGALYWSSVDPSADAVVPIYSITKTFTAICALLLKERGALDLDRPARRWLPDVAIPDAITVAHLLRHASGLREYGPLSSYHDAVRSHPDTPWTRQQFLDRVLAGGLLFAPGTGWSYSNVGYMLAIEILERVGDRGFADLIRDLIVAPLGLRQTFALERPEDLLRCAPGFGTELTADRRAVDVRGLYHPGWCAPRVLASTAAETTLVFDTLFAGDLLQPDTLAEMLTTVPLPLEHGDTEPIGSGLGIYSAPANDARSFAHGGGGPGYSLWVTVRPGTRIGRVTIANFVTSSVSPGAGPDGVSALFASVADGSS